MKENELQYLKKEVQCLRDELQMMQKVSPSQVKQGVCGWGTSGSIWMPHPVSTCSVPGTPRASPTEVSLSPFTDKIEAKKGYVTCSRPHLLLFIQQIFIEHLLHARHHARCWETAVNKKGPNPFTRGTCIPVWSKPPC